MTHYMVFDVESIGLHGDAFAIGYVVVDETGKRLEERLFASYERAEGDEGDREWVNDNVPYFLMSSHSMLYRYDTLREMRAAFWQAWRSWAERGATLWADCAWPVEARFLARCVDDVPVYHKWQGPYPLHEIATLALVAGHDPTATVARLPDEWPQHDPLNDARQSARLLLQYLGELQAVRNA